MGKDDGRPDYCENPGQKCPEKQHNPETGKYECAGCIWLQVEPATPVRCELCEGGDPSHAVTCFNCGNFFHLHQSQLNKVQPGMIIAANCPYCRRPNAWRRTPGGVENSGPVVTHGLPILDLRGRK